MNCTACNGALAVLPSGSLARCGGCGAYFGLSHAGPQPLAVTAPWPARSKEELEDEAEDRAFDVQAAAPPGGPLTYLKFIIPVVVLVVMIIVVVTVVMGMQQNDPAPGAAPPPGKTPHAAPPAKKK